MDPLSEILSLLKPQNYTAGVLEVGGRWSIKFPPYDGRAINWYVILSGKFLLSVEGVTTHLEAGDCILLPRGQTFILGNDLSVEPADAYEIFKTPLDGGVRIYNGGGKGSGIGGYFSFASDQASILLDMLPPVVHIDNESDKLALRSSMEQLMQELREPQPGGFLVAQNLAYMLLVKALRICLAKGPQGGIGWLYALADKQMGKAINYMHSEPAHRWTLEELAEKVNMSRSSFAQKFKTTVGNTPIEYLTQWRMLLATDRLANTNESISTIALSLGYDSESAFGTAFKRVMGCSPRQYERQRVK